uniref:IQ domain-containing protein C n=1 Tax=Semicossyphus pulcher TaxID=241346 RepID=UPI0037E7D306
MDRLEWEKILTCFQAFARGYLMRREVRRAREDFEDIVREVDGGLTHLEWRETHIISIPHFTDTDGLFLQASSSASKPSNPGVNVCATPQSLSAAAAAPSISEDRDHHVLREKIEAERDGPQTKGLYSLSNDFSSSSNVRGSYEGQRQTTVEGKDGGVMESAGDSTTVWSSFELDTDYGHSHKGARQYHSVQDVPCTPEALRLHRNTLTMELLWLQQAIGSRKKVR